MNSNEPIRRGWLEGVAGQCQSLIGRAVVAGDVTMMPVLADEFADAIGPPVSRAEDLLLRSVLVETAFKWGTWIHRSLHCRSCVSCRFSPGETLACFWCNPGSEARASFRMWAVACADELARTHPPTRAQRAAALLRRRYADPWDSRSLARAVGTSPSHLRRVFQREFGIGIREFQQRVRLLRAIERFVFAGEKIEAVALEVGFRSKKTLYRAIRELTGTTPGGLRALPVDTARGVVDAAAATLLRIGSIGDPLQ